MAIAQNPAMPILYFTKAHYIDLAHLDTGFYYSAKALNLQPNYPAAVAFKGLLYAYSGNPVMAKKNLWNSIELGKNTSAFADPYLILGGIYTQEKNIDSADYCFRTAYRLDPCSLGAWEKVEENN